MFFVQVLTLTLLCCGVDGVIVINLNATDTKQYLNSLNYPADYPANANYQWNVVSNLPNKYIAVRFLDFEMEESRRCTYDKVRITSAGTVKGIFCGSPADLPAIFTQSLTATLTFMSDGSIAGRGFRIEYFVSESDPFLNDKSTVLVAVSVSLVLVIVIVGALCLYLYHRKKKSDRLVSILQPATQLTARLPLQPLPPIKARAAFKQTNNRLNSHLDSAPVPPIPTIFTETPPSSYREESYSQRGPI